MTEQAFSHYCVCYCVYLHAGIYLLKHRMERFSEYLTIRYWVTFLLKTTKNNHTFISVPRVWTRGRTETESRQRVSGAKSP